jgi:hypothetical protein
MPLGWFDESAIPLGWWDETADPLGWWDDLLMDSEDPGGVTAIPVFRHHYVNQGFA